tara:strand:- start:804 stop:1949 length:1146 start_codon:yes stop_codon:yes gene_type:complete
MGLLTDTQVRYYSSSKSFTGDGTTKKFTVSMSYSAFPATYTASNANVYIDNDLYIQTDVSGNVLWKFQWDTTGPPTTDGWYIEFSTAPTSGVDIVVNVSTDYGNYQFISLNGVIDNFMATYTGEDKILTNTKRSDASFHAHRALAELSFDTFRSTKSQEVTIPPSLTMILPQDYVNYIKLTWSDSSGIEHVLYPVRQTSNPFNPKQNTDGTFSFDTDDDGNDDSLDLIPKERSDTWGKYKALTPSENQESYSDDYYVGEIGQRFGIDPEHAQTNGSFFIDELKGLIHFSSNINGKTVILHYMSDSLGDEDEMKVHKLAEEAIYKHIIYGCISAKLNVPEYIVNRFRRERFAETRKAKLRLSNIKIEEITQILRGKSKQIKH